MDWIAGFLVVAGIYWWFVRRQRKPAELVPPAPRFEDYQDKLERRPVEELDGDEQIIRRAHDAFDASRKARSAEYRAKKDALTADEKRIARATDFIETSYLSLALPFVQEETQYWPSWIVNQNGKWVPPIPVTDLAKNEDGITADKRWAELRPEGLPLYRIEFERSRMPGEGDYEYGSMTLFVEGDEVLGMFVRRNWQKEWNRWEFSLVESLKVEQWIDGFMAFYNQLRSIKENESEDYSSNFVRAKAAKIDLGD